MILDIEIIDFEWQQMVCVFWVLSVDWNLRYRDLAETIELADVLKTYLRISR